MRPIRRGPWLGAYIGMLLILAGQPTSAALAQTVPGPVEDALDCSIDGYDDRCEAWMAIEDDPDGLAPDTFPNAMAASPDGNSVYVIMTESAPGSDLRSRWAVVARDVDTGAERWSYREDGAPTGYSVPSSITVSPDNTRVYVSGTQREDYWAVDGSLVLKAFDAQTGEILWTETYNGTPGYDGARQVIVSPDGAEIYTAGVSGAGGNYDYTALAFDAATGQRRWVTRYKGVDLDGSDAPFDVALTPDGSTLLMTGWSDGYGEYNVDYATVAVGTRGPDAGSIRWSARYDARGAQAPDRANAIAVSPDGATVYAGGMTAGASLEPGGPWNVDYDFTTIAYDVETGQQRWKVERRWQDHPWQEVTDLAVSPDGSTLYASGFAWQSAADSASGHSNTDAVLVAYDAATGAEKWSVLEALTEHDGEHAMTVLATDDAVVMTEASSTYLTEPMFLMQKRLLDGATNVYDPADGSKLWTARVNATRIGQTWPMAAVIAGDRLVVTARDSDNIAVEDDIYDGATYAYDLT